MDGGVKKQRDLSPAGTLKRVRMALRATKCDENGAARAGV
jgi:hypothetical protein